MALCCALCCIDVGQLFSMFCYHIEDSWLYSVSYNHDGLPKIWYTVPGAEMARFERVLEQNIFPGLAQSVNGTKLAALKTSLFSPAVLMVWPHALTAAPPMRVHASAMRCVALRCVVLCCAVSCGAALRSEGVSCSAAQGLFCGHVPWRIPRRFLSGRKASPDRLDG